MNQTRENIVKHTRRELEEMQRDLARKGVRQKLNTDARCLRCMRSPVLFCNTFTGDFVTGRECKRPVCLECAIIRSGIVYCYECGKRYR